MNAEKIRIEGIIINKILDFFRENTHDANNEEMKMQLRKWIAQIILIEVGELEYEVKIEYGYRDRDKDASTSKLLIINFDSIEKYGAENVPAYFSSSVTDEYIPSISIVEERFFEGLDNENYIERMKATIYSVQALFHELNHLKLNKIARTNTCSFEAFRYVESLLLSMCSSRFYKKNHDAFFLEEEADVDSVRKWKNLTSEPWVRKAKNTSQYHNIYEVLPIKISKYSKYLTRETFDYLFTARELKKKNQFVKGFPILEKYYNEDGTEKNIIELVKNMKEDFFKIANDNQLTSYEKEELIHDCRKLYYELFYRAMVFQNNNKENVSIAVDEYNNTFKSSLFVDMKTYFKKKMKEESEKINQCFDYEVKAKELKLRKRSNIFKLFLLKTEEVSYMINRKKNRSKDDSEIDL